MFTRYKLLRMLAVFLCVTLIITALTACFKQPITYETDGPANSPAQEEVASVDSQINEEMSAEPSPPPLGESFASGVGTVLLLAAGKDDMISSAPFDLLMNPSKQDIDTATYSTTTIRLSDGADSDTTYVVKENNNTETGDASFVLDTSTANGESTQCGVYFYDNILLVKKANVESPMVRHSLNPQVAGSYLGLPALGRFNRVLNDTTRPKQSETEWTAAVDTYLGQVGDIAKDPDYSVGDEGHVYAGVPMDCTATTLKLMGNRAVQVARGLAALISEDTTFRSLFNAADTVDKDEPGVTGLSGVLRDIDALDDDTRQAAILTFKLVEADVPIGINVTLTAGDQTFVLNLAFFEDGYLHDFDMAFTGMDGSAVYIKDVNVSAGRDQYTADFLGAVSGPGGDQQVKMTATIQSVMTAGGYTAQTQYAYSRAATEAMDALALNADLRYEQTDGEELTTTASGTLELISGDSATDYTLELHRAQSRGAVAVTPPEFLPSAGVSTADQLGLYKALGDFDGKSFVRSPMTTQLLAGLFLLTK